MTDMPSTPVPSPSSEVPQPYNQVPQAPQPSTSAELVRHHVHHSYIWLSSIQVATTLLVVILISSFSGIAKALSDGDSLSPTILLIIVACIVGGFVLIVGIIALIQWLSYKNLYYVIGNEEFDLYSGILNKKHVHVPYQRIQSVDQRASLLQRVFGVCTVNIDTAGGSANKAVSVPYVRKSQAEQLRQELFARKQFLIALQNGAAPQEAAAAVAAASGVVLSHVAGFQSGGAGNQTPHNVLDAPAEIWQDVRGVFAGAAVDTGHVTYEYGLSNKELVFTGLSSNTAFVVAIVGIMGAVTQVASEFAPLFSDMFKPLVGNAVAFGAQLFGGNLIAAGVAAVLGIAVVIWGLSIIGTCVSFGGFSACRRDNRIEVEHGLLQHQFQGVDVDRVQSVVVKQSFIRRLLGYCELSLGKIDASSENSNEQQNSLNQQGVILHPFVKMNRVPEILAGLLPEFADVPLDSTPVAPVALRRVLIRRGIVQGDGFWLAIIITIAQACANAFVPATTDGIQILYYVNIGVFVGYALCVVLFILNLVGAVLWFHGSGFSYNKHFMQVSNGGFARETVSFPRKKIQYGYTKTNPLQRHAKTVTVHARTAAGVGGTTTRLVDVCEEDALTWLDWLKPHGNMVQ